MYIYVHIYTYVYVFVCVYIYVIFNLYSPAVHQHWSLHIVSVAELD